MKTKLFFLAAIAITLVASSCGKKHKVEAERLSLIADSLQMVVEERETLSLTYIMAYNEIQENLDSIKQIERLITESTEGQTERKSNLADDINRDINAIYDLLVKNREIVENMRRQIRNSGQSNKELEKMIAHLSFQIESKDAEIALLKEELERKQIQIEDLERNLARIERQSRDRAAALQAKTDEMNLAWYIIGNRKFLEDKGIITKTGGFIGIGASRKVSEDFEKEHFTRIDIREKTAFPVFSRKAQVLTIHPSGSYELTGHRSVDSLLIRHADDFWSASRFMVVVIE